jgi:hypothetical protein
MIKTRLLALSAILSMATGSMFADAAPAAAPGALPVLVVQEVQTKDADAYVASIAKINALVKARIGVEHYRHVWEGDFAGSSSHALFVVSAFASATELYQDQDKLKNYPEMDVILAQIKDQRHLGDSTLYKGIRNEGVYDGGVVYNTGIAVTDEPAYLKDLDALRAIFDSSGFKDAKLNLYRAILGREKATHLVVIAFPTAVRLGEFLDALHDKGLLNDWNVEAAKARTSLTNGSYHEITK